MTRIIPGPQGWRVLDPPPLPHEMKARYENDEFYRDDGPAWFAKEKREHEAGLWRPAYKWQYKLLGGSTLVDVGAGAGWFVDFWLQQGWDAWGIEPSQMAREASPQPAHLWSEAVTVDNAVLRFSFVLEHIPNPTGFLRRYLKQYQPKRVLVIVPNEFNPLQRAVLRRDPTRLPWIQSEWHINYFDPVGLRKCFDLAGLKIVHEGATFPLELFILAGLDYRHQPVLGGRIHLLRLRFEKVLGPLAFRLYRSLYRSLGWGRELMFVGEPF